MYNLIDGKKVASEIKKEIAEEVAESEIRQAKKFRTLWLYLLEITAQAKPMLPTR